MTAIHYSFLQHQMAHGGGSAYTTGVTVVGTAGQSGSYVEIVVSSSTLQHFIIIVQTILAWVALQTQLEPVVIYNHEQGLNYDIVLFLRDKWISIGNGDQVAKVTGNSRRKNSR